MSKKRILAIFSGILGNKTLSDRYLEVFKRLDDYELSFFYITGDDYVRYPASGLARFSSFLRLADIAKRKYKDCCQGEYDLLFINGYDIAFGLLDQVKMHPTMLALDAVPELVHELLGRTSGSFLGRMRSAIKGVVAAVLYRGLFKNIDYFLPMTRWCADGLEHCYRVSNERMAVSYCPCDLNYWHPREQGVNEKVHLLFVGNDFRRKGGDFLLKIFESHFQETCLLTVISNDSMLSSGNLPEGVELRANVRHEGLIPIFQWADIFVFPTRKEYLGVVATEACATGLPVIARDVGGLREFIIDGHNGYLMPYESGEKEWVAKIQYLIDYSEERIRMGINSRKLAEEMFGMEKFEKIVREAVGSLVRAHGTTG